MSEQATPPEALSADDLAFLQAALGRIREAQAGFQFVSGHLAAKYRLGPLDGVDDGTGAIIRAPIAEESAGA